MDKPDMPIFVIKAKDALSVPALKHYKEKCEDHGLTEQARQVDYAIYEFRQWQDENIDDTKLPDHRHVPVNRNP